MKKAKLIRLISFGILAAIYFQACSKPGIAQSGFLPKLSDYAIYNGKATDLVPNSGYKLYELSSQLFTDYAEKQRLIKIPANTKITAVDNGLVNFPEGTIIVKTFYYYHDKRDVAKGKRLIETRLLVKTNGVWNAGTYMWNDEQTDATSITSGLNKTVNWIDNSGTGNVISYHIPNNTECGTCHNSNSSMMPIGPKVRNMNFDVVRSNVLLNQLTHLQNEAVLSSVNPATFIAMPNYKDTTLSIEKRARAYLDINCAHCHSDKGFASSREPRFGYEHSLQDSKILDTKARIINKTQTGKMPKMGTSIIDKEGVALIKKYIDGL
jgi:uncharacterized repeat protein (TIGR03806 family)